MNCSSVRENSDCRVKCKLQVDGKWKLLLLREETGTPTKQVCYNCGCVCIMSYLLRPYPCRQCCYCTQVPVLTISICYSAGVVG